MLSGSAFRVALLAVSSVLAVFFLVSAQADDKPSAYGEGADRSVYGEKHPVRTVEDARENLNEFYSGLGYTVFSIKELELYFEAEVRDKSGKVVDRVVIDKRTGRIRSIF
jgi:hypothetical protein